MAKYSTHGESYPQKEPIGYRHKKNGSVYWRDIRGDWVFFNTLTGCSHRATCFEERNTSLFEPIYDEIVIKITA